VGHDPFADMDMDWLEQENGELYIKVLGDDPFEDVDLEWEVLTEEVEGRPSVGEAEDDSFLDVTEGFAVEQAVVERASLERVFEEGVGELEVQPRPEEPLQPVPPTGVAPVKGPLRYPAVREEVVSRPAATFYFPADFRWGVTTSAHQVEGDNMHNDWWAWEQQEGRIKRGQASGLACDWWENAEADFDRAAELGLNALRLSIEWSRVEPAPGEFDDGALTRYGHMLAGLRERGIEPMVTLHHFTNPHWLAEQGGWENSGVVALFARFVRRTVESLGQYCDLWCTINGLNVYGYLGYVEGVFPPGQSDFKVAMRVIRHLLAGHAAAYREIHTLQPQARVGIAHAMRVFDPANPRSFLDRRVARRMDKVYNQAVLSALTRGVWMPPLGFGLAWKLRRTLDWIGLNYRTRDLVAFDRAHPQTLFGRRQTAGEAGHLESDGGECYPRGIFRCLQRLARLELPVYVTENGVADADGDRRPQYLLTHLHQVWRALQLGCPVMGYYHRTLVDSFEWTDGWTRRFGLIALDPETQARTPRDSAALCAEVVGVNGINPHMIDTYAPELRSELLPG
jgi:beta-glucosidase